MDVRQTGCDSKRIGDEPGWTTASEAGTCFG